MGLPLLLYAAMSIGVANCSISLRMFQMVEVERIWKVRTMDGSGNKYELYGLDDREGLLTKWEKAEGGKRTFLADYYASDSLLRQPICICGMVVCSARRYGEAGPHPINHMCHDSMAARLFSVGRRCSAPVASCLTNLQ